MVEARARPGFVVGRRLLTSSHARRFHEVVVCSPCGYRNECGAKPRHSRLTGLEREERPPKRHALAPCYYADVSGETDDQLGER